MTVCLAGRIVLGHIHGYVCSSIFTELLAHSRFRVGAEFPADYDLNWCCIVGMEPSRTLMCVRGACFLQSGSGYIFMLKLG